MRVRVRLRVRVRVRTGVANVTVDPREGLFRFLLSLLFIILS